ncbi:phosphoheptose isomerase [Sphingomonas ginkgonis]|uniref:Phosphoheptose isomerase n=1 Tax=Sphingomonas ginkgonis TaxID=2315330 RepID=A0A3R9Y567_9SPHN|nr:class I mannose-6-phosphate isomerase [Sphingomonas ginkgonis]RST30389.1 phosphoheptose isomerase [Sphingomonas ginkgonis]
MTLTKLETRRVHKVWGQRQLWGPFADPAPGEEPIGEVWFEDPRGIDRGLLIKYLFTQEKLSIQVHPGDEQAHRLGLPRGKDEAWVVLKAEPGATIAMGLKQPESLTTVRAAALDGTLQDLVDWRPVAANRTYFSPSGTIHAIGAGLTVIEIQQNSDTTYRLFDYGRDRELHLDDGLAVSSPVPYSFDNSERQLSDHRAVIVAAPTFTLERVVGPCAFRLSASEPVWLVPVEGDSAADDQSLDPGSAWLAEGAASLRLGPGAVLLLAHEGTEPLAIDEY